MSTAAAGQANELPGSKTRSGTVLLNGGMHCFELSGRGPVVVLIPGFTLDTRMWDPQVEAFGEQFTVLRYDLRGAGGSDPPTGPYAYHEDLKALLDHLGIERAHVIGLSLGAAIAVEFALAYPPATASLVAVDTSGLGGFPWPPELSAWFGPINEAGQRGDIEAAKAHWLATGWFAPALERPEVARALRDCIGRYGGWHFAHANPVLRLAPPAIEQLEAISAPTLVLVGERDLDFYNHPIAQTLAERIPGAQKVVLAGVGHMANMEDPAQFNQVVLDFLAQVPNRSP